MTTHPLLIYIDDEPSLCRLFDMALREEGFEVRTFTNPLEALEVINDPSQPIAAVLCDQSMPELVGTEVLERLERPLPFFLVTGDTSLIGVDVGGPTFQGIIGKPFEGSEVARQIRALLD